MVDLIYGRSITDLLHEMPFYISIFKKTMVYRLFGSKQPMYGSVDVNNVCNLHCTHCYWWLNRKEEGQDMTAEDWKK
jgi:Fe-coproporphyrin III synthase